MRYLIEGPQGHTGHGAHRKKNAIEIARRLAERAPGVEYRVVDTGPGAPLRRIPNEGNGHHRFTVDPLTHPSLTEADYPSIFGDYDRDGVPDVDDPHPYGPPSSHSIEEVRLASEMRALLQTRSAMEDVYRTVEAELGPIAQQMGGQFYGRVKTPYSIINKMRRRSLTGKDAIPDIIGTSVVVPTRRDVERVRDAVERGAFGKCLSTWSFYKQPFNGYRAYHFVIARPVRRADGTTTTVPFELQLKTPRLAAIGKGTHEAYKRGTADPVIQDALFAAADTADRGSRHAAAVIDREIARGTEHIARLASGQGGDDLLDQLRGVIRPGGTRKVAARGWHPGAGVAGAPGSPVPPEPTSETARLSNPGREKAVQSLLFARPQWTPTSAREWARSHGYVFSNAAMEITDNYVRIRQVDPGRFTKLRTIVFGDGIKAVYGIP